MDSPEFKSLLTAPGPFVSMYFDDSRDTAEAEALLHARWSDLRRNLQAAGADEAVIPLLQRAVLLGEPAVGRQGRGIVAARDEVLINEHLTSAPAAGIVRVSDYPYVLPLVEFSGRRPTYVFAAVDHLGADITLHGDGGTRTETVDGGGYPVHKPVTAGWHGYGDVTHSVEEAVRMNVRSVADRLTELVDMSGADVVFVCGEVRSRTDVVSALPDRVTKRVSQLHGGAQGHRIRETEVGDMIEAEFEQRKSATVAEVTDRFISETGRRAGLAAEGLAQVCAALRDGRVDTLIVGDVGDTTVVTGQNRTAVAPDADSLSVMGEAAVRVARADEALPFAALATGAAVIKVDNDINPSDGVGALLRFPLDVKD